MSQPPAEERHFLRYQALNHWRGAAALAVVAFHVFALPGTGPAGGVYDLLRLAASRGYLGVHLFFVISGYCIAANLHRSALTHRPAGEFFRDRLLRIYPLYWAAFAVQLGLALAVFPFTRAGARLPWPGSGAEWLADLLLAEPYAGFPGAMLVTWTLVYEVGFYVLCGAGFLAARRGGGYRAWSAAALALAVLSLCPLPQPAFLVLKYWPEFVCGGLVYVARLEAVREARGYQRLWLAALVALPLLGWKLQGPELRLELWCAAGAALLLYLLAPWEQAVVSAGWLRWLGATGVTSYSLYLIHVPVLVQAANLARRLHLEQSPWRPAWAAASFLAAWASGYLFYRWAERPLERFRVHLRHRPAAVVRPARPGSRP